MPEVSLGEMEVKLQVIAFIRHLSLGTLSSGLSSRINSSRDSNVFKFYHTIFSYLRRNLWSWTMYCRHSYLVSAFCPLPQSHSLWDFFLRHYGIFYETIWMEDGPQTKTQKNAASWVPKIVIIVGVLCTFATKKGFNQLKNEASKRKKLWRSQRVIGDCLSFGIQTQSKLIPMKFIDSLRCFQAWTLESTRPSTGSVIDWFGWIVIEIPADT